MALNPRRKIVKEFHQKWTGRDLSRWKSGIVGQLSELSSNHPIPLTDLPLVLNALMWGMSVEKLVERICGHIQSSSQNSVNMEMKLENMFGVLSATGTDLDELLKEPS